MANEEKYKALRREILDESSGEEGDSGEDADEESEENGEESEDEEEAKQKEKYACIFLTFPFSPSRGQGAHFANSVTTEDGY